MKLRDLLKEIKAVPGGSVNILALVDKLKANGEFGKGYKLIAYRESKFKTKNDEIFLIELLVETNIEIIDNKKVFRIIEYLYYPEFNHFEYYNTTFGNYEPEDERLQDLIKNRNFTIINPPITEIKAKPALKLPSGFDIEQAFYDFFDTRQVSPPKGKFNKDEQFLGIKYKTIDDEDLIFFYFQIGGMFNEKFQVVYNLDDPYTPNKNYTTWRGYRDINKTDLIKEIKAIPAKAHPLNIEAIWDFVSNDYIKGELGPFDINKNYIGFEKLPFGRSNANMHLIKTYFRDNKGNLFNVIYSYNYGRENGYDFFNWWNIDEDEIPNNLLREIKAIPGALTITREEAEEGFFLTAVNVGDERQRNTYKRFKRGYEYLGYTREKRAKSTLFNFYYKNKSNGYYSIIMVNLYDNPLRVVNRDYQFFHIQKQQVPFDELINEIKIVPGGGESRLPFSIEDVKKRSYEDYLKRQKPNPFTEKETKGLEFIGYTASSEDGITTYNLYFAYTFKGPVLLGSMNYKKIPVRYNNSNENDPKQEIGTFKILRKWPNYESSLSKNEVPFDKLIK